MSEIKNNVDLIKHVVNIVRGCGVGDELDFRICNACEHFEGYCHFPWWLELQLDKLQGVKEWARSEKPDWGGRMVVGLSGTFMGRYLSILKNFNGKEVHIAITEVKK